MENKVFTLLSLLIFSMEANLICNGDFQAIPTSQSFSSYSPLYRNGQSYDKTYIDQNTSCWYLKNSTESLEIKRVYNPPVIPSLVCDLIPVAEAAPLCQMLNLEMGKIYNLSFDLYSNQNKNQNDTLVTVNQRNLTKVRVNNIYQAVQTTVLFVADLDMTELCFTFQGTHPYYKGSNLDNVNLVKIDPFLYYQEVWATKILLDDNHSASTILIQTNYYVPEGIKEILNQTIKVFVKNNPQAKVSFDLVYKNNSALQIYVYGSVQYFNDITVEFPDKIFYNFTQIYFSLNEYSDTESYTFVASMMKWMKIMGKAFLCSYFVFSLMGIWNLLLLYNFLLVKCLPSYVFITLGNFSTTFYSGSSIIQQIPFFSNLILNLQKIDSNDEIRKLPRLMGDYTWFGSIGFSSGFFSNNAEDLILLLILLVKLSIFSAINSFLSKKLHIRKVSFRHRLHIFLVQIISNSPQTIIGAASNFLHMENSTTISRVSASFSVCTLIVISLVIFWDYTILQFIQREPEKNSQKLQGPKLYNYHQAQDQLHFFMLHLIIPFCVVTRFDFLFFTSVSLIVGRRFYKCYTKRKLMKGFYYFKLFSINLGWIFYHSIFFYFWLVGKYSLMESYRDDQNYQLVLSILGNFLIFYIIFAAAIEIIDFIITFPSKYLRPLFKTCKLLIGVKKSQISPLQKQETQPDKEKVKCSLEKITRKEREIFTMWNNKNNSHAQKIHAVVHDPIKHQDKRKDELKPVRKNAEVKKTKEIHCQQNGSGQMSLIRHPKWSQ